MLQNPRKTLGFKKNMVYKFPPGGEVNHIQPVAYVICQQFLKATVSPLSKMFQNFDFMQNYGCHHGYRNLRITFSTAAGTPPPPPPPKTVSEPSIRPSPSPCRSFVFFENIMPLYHLAVVLNDKDDEVINLDAITHRRM